MTRKVKSIRDIAKSVSDRCFELVDDDVDDYLSVLSYLLADGCLHWEVDYPDLVCKIRELYDNYDPNCESCKRTGERNAVKS